MFLNTRSLFFYCCLWLFCVSSENKDASISEIHGFVKKIPQLTQEYKSLNRHINIAELVKQTTDSVEFREQWQGERGMLEGESYLDQIEDIISADTDRFRKFHNLFVGGIFVTVFCLFLEL